MAAIGVDTMKKISSLSVLIIGLKGTGVETAKNLILTGPQLVALWDDDLVQMADLGTNFYLTPDQCDGKTKRAEACGKRLDELNPYCSVEVQSGTLTDEYIQSFGAVVVTKILPRKELFRINQLCRTHLAAVVVTKILPRKELFRINQLCRTRQDANGKPAPAAFVLALTQGITAHLFTDFGPCHTVTDQDGEPARSLVIDDLDEDGVITVPQNQRHGFDDGDEITIEDIEGAPTNGDTVSITELNNLDDGDEITIEDIEGAPTNGDTVSITELNNLQGIKVKRIYYKYDYKRPDGKVEKREKQVFEKFQLDLSGTKLAGKKLSKWKTGGLVTEVKATKELKFRSLEETLRVP
eukprot:CAMPEP_0197075706 /NCGR_PEP_ID=MMETSP1384-20130603/211746_1 /TAXON_ID=29189 /ORGANISM="Ammonia sp." /LENGTH=352 /DNA_ID=CAMNT_0042514555 /DNA_START=54 /DNA_END=1109 /DNA_ORIENTATION=+